MDNKELKWKNVPSDWALCFNQNCPMHERCLRWLAAQLAPEELTICRCVMPQALKKGQCPHFATAEKVRMARGFMHLYDKVLKDDYTSLRKTLTSMLSGKRYYYEYRRGDRLLSPENQEKIRQLFASRGYADSVRFDDYEEEFVFPWP